VVSPTGRAALPRTRRPFHTVHAGTCPAPRIELRRAERRLNESRRSNLEVRHARSVRRASVVVGT
jgi:hypothetical protein